MKVNVKYMRNIHMTTEISGLVRCGEVKMVKNWMLDTKDQLQDYVGRMVEKAEHDLKISITDIYELEATYYNSYDMPVITIVGRGYDRRPDADRNPLFVEAFTSEENGTVENRYTRNH